MQPRRRPELHPGPHRQPKRGRYGDAESSLVRLARLVDYEPQPATAASVTPAVGCHRQARSLRGLLVSASAS